MRSWKPEMNTLAPWDCGEGAKLERSVKSAERTLALFELFSLCQCPLTVGQMASELDIPQPSVTMLVRNLVRLGYLEHDRSQRTYLPTVRIMLLGNWVHRQFNRESNMEEHLERLRQRCNETVLLGLQNGLYCQYVCAVLPDQPRRLEVQSGMLRPLTRTAIGKVLLSRMHDPEVSLLLRRSNAEFADHLRVAPAEFMAEIEKVRKCGTAETRGDMTPGVSTIAIGIPTLFGNIPMAVGVGGPTERFLEKRELLLEALQEMRDNMLAHSESFSPPFLAGSVLADGSFDRPAAAPVNCRWSEDRTTRSTYRGAPGTCVVILIAGAPPSLAETLQTRRARTGRDALR
jgi:DNA-binding IclR family transcriptional regulator